jgi:hypothetical protein
MTSVVGCFDGRGGAPGQYRRHRPMQHVQGYSGSYWMPALGDCLLRIAPVAARATGKQTTVNKYTYKAGRFDGHGRYVTVRIAQWRRSRASLKATGCRHRASIISNNINWTWLRRFFYVFIVKTVGKGHGSMLRTLFLIGV